MVRIFAGLLVAAVLALPAIAASDHAKRHPRIVWHGYGFLPGYRSPERIERETPLAATGHYFYGYPGYNFYGGPGFYRGRWNGGGFGECWTQTPIGPYWTCG
jgi:hypothetical protein